MREREYFGQALRKLENIEWVEIGSICKLVNGKAFKPSDWKKQESGGLPIIRIQNLNNKKAEFNYYTGNTDQNIVIHSGDLLFSWSGSRGTSFGAHIWRGENAVLNQHIFKVEHTDNIDRKYLYLALNDAVTTIEENLHGGVGLVHITKGNLEKIKIPIPSPEVQKQLVAEVEREEEIATANRHLIELMEQKIQAVLGEI